MYSDVLYIFKALCMRSLTAPIILVTDNHLQKEAQISFQGKKKSLKNQITGFQVASTEHQFFTIGKSSYVLSSSFSFLHFGFVSPPVLPKGSSKIDGHFCRLTYLNIWWCWLGHQIQGYPLCHVNLFPWFLSISSHICQFLFQVFIPEVRYLHLLLQMASISSLPVRIAMSLSGAMLPMTSVCPTMLRAYGLVSVSSPPMLILQYLGMVWNPVIGYLWPLMFSNRNKLTVTNLESQRMNLNVIYKIQMVINPVPITIWEFYAEPWFLLRASAKELSNMARGETSLKLCCI